MVSQIDIGHEFLPVAATVEPGRLRFFRSAIGENNPIYCDRESARKAGYSNLPVPPTYLFCLEMLDSVSPFNFIDDLGIDIARLLHGEQHYNYFAPVCVGDQLIFTTTVADVVEKKGGSLTILKLETKVTNSSDDRTVAEMTRVLIVKNG